MVEFEKRYEERKKRKRKRKKGAIDVSTIIAIAIGVIVMAILLPVAFDQFYEANTANWTINGQQDTKVVNIWYLLPFFIVLALLIAIVKMVS